MALIDIDKFVASIMYRWNNPEMKTIFNDMKYSLIDQGLEYKDGEIVKNQRRVSAEAKENGYSELEDEKIRKRLMAMCQHYIECYAFDQYNLVGYKEALDWLKKQGEQKPTWSEEDEKAINDIMWIIEAYRENGFNETHKQMANNAEKWLKSLKQGYGWKPSKEQMDAMQMAVSYFDCSWISKEQKLLESLYKDLKKL